MNKRFGLFLEKWLSVEVHISVIILGFLIALIAYQVLVRYLFNAPLSWAEELAALLLIYLSFLTGDIIYKKKGHISIDFFVSFFPERLRLIIQVAVNLFVCLFLIVLCVKSLPLIKAQLGYTTAAALHLPKSFWTLPVPIIFLSMFLTTAHFIFQDVGKLRT
jgi:TRAP-type C4-dicarboxylate transport system permease small subunit